MVFLPCTPATLPSSASRFPTQLVGCSEDEGGKVERSDTSTRQHAGQFTTFEALNEYVASSAPLKKLQASGKAGEVTVSLGCGMGAGVIAAILSHPADTLLSRINQGEGGKGSAMSKLVTLAGEAGFSGLWAGLQTRILMTAFLIGGQFLLYISDGYCSPLMFMLTILTSPRSYVPTGTTRSSRQWARRRESRLQREAQRRRRSSDVDDCNASRMASDVALACESTCRPQQGGKRWWWCD